MFDTISISDLLILAPLFYWLYRKIGSGGLYNDEMKKKMEKLQQTKNTMIEIYEDEKDSEEEDEKIDLSLS